MSATIVSQFAQPKEHNEQQCVRDNVSSFARALIPSSQCFNSRFWKQETGLKFELLLA